MVDPPMTRIAETIRSKLSGGSKFIGGGPELIFPEKANVYILGILQQRVPVFFHNSVFI
jgi:hypothetical protein